VLPDGAAQQAHGRIGVTHSIAGVERLVPGTGSPGAEGFAVMASGADGLGMAGIDDRTVEVVRD
jgi:hypothetical protein